MLKQQAQKQRERRKQEGKDTRIKTERKQEEDRKADSLKRGEKIRLKRDLKVMRQEEI